MSAKLKDPDAYFIKIDINFAKEFGVNEAIVAGKMLRLADKLPGAKDDDGIKWVRLTLEEWAKELPFLSEMTIRRTIENLEDKKIFLSTTFSGRSKWYRINPAFVESGHNTSVQNEQKHYGNCSKRTDVSVQNEQLPIIHSYNPSYSLSLENLPLAKTNKEAEAILLQGKEMALNLIKVCGYAGPEYVVNGSKVKCANVIIQLAQWKATPEQIDKFSGYWWGNAPPTFEQVENYWGKFLHWLDNPQENKTNGHKNGTNQKEAYEPGRQAPGGYSPGQGTADHQQSSTLSENARQLGAALRSRARTSGGTA